MTDCEFCAKGLDLAQPLNLAFLGHLETNARCREQFDHLLENIRNSWTPSMSGP